MRWVAILSVLGASSVNAFLRFSCSTITVNRIDPLVNPGAFESPHLHQVAGGNAFNVTMDPKRDIPTTASCTSCTFSEDFSNYWTAVLYYRARNGTLKRVPHVPNKFLEQADRGMTIYYIQPYDGRTKVTAFKPGFRMLVGDPALKSARGMQKQICFRCHSKNILSEQGAPCGATNDYKELPNKVCEGGMRATVHFPTCWDGKNVDSPDHKSHIAYPSSGSFESNGPCPASHPVRIPQVMYEVMWDTTSFNDKSQWPADGSQPFVWSSGDATGFGHHGDYVFGWKGDALQKAMDANCNGPSCSALKTQSYAEANKCKTPQTVKEDIDGWLQKLPGTNPIAA